MSAELRFQEPLRVLVVDDLAADRKVAADIVRHAFRDTTIDEADDYNAALYLALNEYYDLVLLDLALHPDPPGPQEGLEGLWILQEISERGLREHLPVIILTGLGSDAELARHLFKNFKVIDFWSKSKPEAELRDSLLLAVSRLRYFGLGCDVLFDHSLSWRDLIKNLSLVLRRPSVPITEDDAELELRHVLRKLFSDCSSVFVAPLEPGHSGAAVLRVNPTFPDHSRGAEVVVKYGSSDQVVGEVSHYQDLASYMRGYRSTQLQGHVLGRRLGAVRYTLVGAGEGDVSSFALFYSQGSVTDIEHVLSGLFTDTCRLFYAEDNRAQPEVMSLEQEYCRYLNLSRDRIQTAFEFKYPDKPLQASLIDFVKVPRRFRHPVAALLAGEADWTTETWRCRTHGDLHSGNILVDAKSRDAWLIDFFRGGFGHWVRDFVALEACIKFQHTPARDLSSLFLLEEALSQPETLADAVEYHEDDQPELLKAAHVIANLRRMAAGLLGSWDPRAGMEDYYVGLFFEAINYLRLHRLIKQPVRKNHVLLSAAILFERIVTLRQLRNSV